MPLSKVQIYYVPLCWSYFLWKGKKASSYASDLRLFDKCSDLEWVLSVVTLESARVKPSFDLPNQEKNQFWTV